MEVFFIRNRKILLFGSVFMLFYFFYQVYQGFELFNSNHIGGGTGTFVEASISLFVSVYFFINVRKANRAFKEENGAETNNNKISEV